MNAQDPFPLLRRCAATLADAVLVLVLALLILQATSPGTTVVPMSNGPSDPGEPLVIEWFAYA